MKKMYQTVAVDLSGCNADVAEAICNNVGIKCKAWDHAKGDSANFTCVAYIKGATLPYKGYMEDEPRKVNQFRFVEPKLMFKKVVKSEVDLLRLFLTRGYTISTGDGLGYSAGRGSRPCNFTEEMFEHCGEVPPNHHVWCDDWLELVPVVQ